MNWKISIIYFLLVCQLPAFGQEIKFVSPIGGTYLRDYFIVRYVDCGKFDKQAKDPYCGSKTQKGHEGTDFFIRSFPQMDSLVPVYAVADGKIFFTKDSLYDRNNWSSERHYHGDNGYNLKWSNEVYGNHIVINHKDSLFTLYANLKKYSIKVKPGDSVKSGQLIAYVGSSGYTPTPYLHFEVRNKKNNNDFVNPFQGSCGSTKSLWVHELAYDTITRVIASGFVPYTPIREDSLEERIYNGSDFEEHQPHITHWVLISGLHKNDVLRTEWHQPDLTMWSSNQMVIKSDEWYSYFWSWTRNPILKGYYGDGWICAFFVNNRLIMKEKFNLREQKKHSHKADH